MEVTKDFMGFADVVDMNYQEVYDFYQAAAGNEDGQTTFQVLPANGAPEDTLIIYNTYNNIGFVSTERRYEASVALLSRT